MALPDSIVIDCKYLGNLCAVAEIEHDELVKGFVMNVKHCRSRNLDNSLVMTLVNY